MINIPKHIEDPFYRYQRPKINLENAKLGVKILNLKEISNALYLTDKTLMKFFQKKNGCKSKQDILFKKKMTSDEIDDQLEELINLLLCNICNNPEFDIYPEKKKAFIKCKACGNENELEGDIKKLLIHEIEDAASKKKYKIKSLEEELESFNINVLGEKI